MRSLQRFENKRTVLGMVGTSGAEEFGIVNSVKAAGVAKAVVVVGEERYDRAVEDRCLRLFDKYRNGQDILEPGRVLQGGIVMRRKRVSSSIYERGRRDKSDQGGIRQL